MAVGCYFVMFANSLHKIMIKKNLLMLKNISELSNLILSIKKMTRLNDGLFITSNSYNFIACQLFISISFNSIVVLINYSLFMIIVLNNCKIY